MSHPIIFPQRNYSLKPDTNMFKMHTHDIYEIYCFLEGNAKYYVEGNIYNLKPNDILIIKKAEAHSLLINYESPYKRIVVNFNSDALLSNKPEELLSFLDNKPLGKNNRYSAIKFNTKNWIYYLENICDANTLEGQQLYLTVLVNELNREYKKISDKETQHDIITDIIEYINSNLTGNLRLDDICKKFYLSKMHLNRRFKLITGSTVWDYVIIKRLLLAKELLQNGARSK